MNMDIIQGNWTRLKGVILKSIGKITNDDREIAEGKEGILIGRLQERYGRARDKARNRPNDRISIWEETLRH